MQFKSQSERMEGVDYESLPIYFKDQLNPELFSIVYREKGNSEKILQDIDFNKYEDVDFNKYAKADILRYCQIYKNMLSSKERKK